MYTLHRIFKNRLLTKHHSYASIKTSFHKNKKHKTFTIYTKLTDYFDGNSVTTIAYYFCRCRCTAKINFGALRVLFSTDSFGAVENSARTNNILRFISERSVSLLQ